MTRGPKEAPLQVVFVLPLSSSLMFVYSVLLSCIFDVQFHAKILERLTFWLFLLFMRKVRHKIRIIKKKNFPNALCTPLNIPNMQSRVSRGALGDVRARAVS